MSRYVWVYTLDINLCASCCKSSCVYSAAVALKMWMYLHATIIRKEVCMCLLSLVLLPRHTLNFSAAVRSQLWNQKHPSLVVRRFVYFFPTIEIILYNYRFFSVALCVAIMSYSDIDEDQEIDEVTIINVFKKKPYNIQCGNY